MSEIQEEAYTELCLEIERLSQENKRHRKLLTRAADRIYIWVDAGLDPSIETKELITELRKAAE